MNARLFFLTLLANNLPESGERQYQNKGTCAPSRRDGFNHGTNEKKKILLPSFPPNKMPAPFPVQRSIEKPTLRYLSGRDAEGIARRGEI
jgi:hypothetical protein